MSNGLDNRRLQAELARLDPFAEAGYFLALHFRFTSPLMLFQTFDEAWIEHYAEQGYVLRDPMIAWSYAQSGATRWSDGKLVDPYGMVEEARGFGLRYGVTISVGPVKSRTVCSVAHSSRDFEDDEIEAIQAIVTRLHGLTEPKGQMTKAQVEALSLIAEGHRHAAAAHLLGISESALKLRLASARERLMARTTPEAIQRARSLNLL
ncbi:autoinducer binding domain-containing protein [Wenxinia saemankumensis]|uniref:LuxR family transcriptional regulator n=1 Tax=Wenxinia saemankumensis TaxID=1447782 RepID=A0A1M6AD36_9RHOB|nr:autoinducer binding domain-containing protein [Wenxinia saemankumensis]SHI34454.1 LuxR family transcriptional regulator [Wenxinia saemankumensis]